MNVRPCNTTESRISKGAAMRTLAVYVLFACIILLSHQSLRAIDVDSLLEKHMEALGGKERLSEITTTSSFISMDYMGLSGAGRVLYKLPLQCRVDLDLGVIEQKIGFDGLTGWMLDESGKVHEMSAEELKPFINDLFLASYAYLLTDRIPFTSRFVSEEKIDGAIYYQIALYPEGGDSVYIMINAETDMIDYRTSFDTGLRLVTHSTDFRPVDGIVMAWDEKTINIDGPISIHSIADSVLINRDLPDSLFAVPGESGIDFLFEENKDSLVIPIERINKHIYIEVRVNGTGPYKFLLDSGAGKNVLDDSLAHALGLSISGTIASRGIGGFGDIAIAGIDSLNIGGLSLHLKKALTTDLSPFARQSGKPIGGILGFDFFQRFPLRIDFMHNRLTIYNPNLRERLEARGMQDFDVYFQLPVFTAEVNGQKVRLLFDLGAQTGILLRHGSEFYERNKALADTISTFAEIMGVGGASRVKVSALDSIRLGDKVIEHPQALWTRENDDLPFPRFIEGILGISILENCQLFIDYGNKKISFAE